jgi:hypothetical protein
MPASHPEAARRRFSGIVLATVLGTFISGGAGLAQTPQPDFPATLWQNTPRSTIEALLPLVGPTTAPSLQSLALRLIASAAPLPPDNAAVNGDTLAGLRVETLNGLGQTSAALALIRATPQAQMAQEQAQVSTDLAFLDNDLQGACDGVTGPYGTWVDSFWMKARLTCQILAGQTDIANQTLATLGAAGADPFLDLARRALGLDAPLPDKLPSPQPLAIALVAKAANGFPYRGLDGAGLSILHAIAVTPGLLADARLAAAEKATAYGALPPQTLAQLYGTLALDPADRTSPLDSAAKHADARGRAILFQAAENAADPATRANYLAAYLGRIGDAGLYQAGVAAAGALLDTVMPSPALKPDAADFAHALYALDRGAQARAWYDIAAQAPLSQPQTRRLQSIAVLAHIAGGDTAPEWAGLSLMPDSTGGSASNATVTRAALAAMLLNALGTPPPDSALISLLADNTAAGTSWPIPAAGPPLLLASSAAGGRVGGTVLAVLASLGTSGAAAAPPQVAQAVAALRAVGLATDARHLAIDAALSAGF